MTKNEKSSTGSTGTRGATSSRTKSDSTTLLSSSPLSQLPPARKTTSSMSLLGGGTSSTSVPDPSVRQFLRTMMVGAAAAATEDTAKGNRSSSRTTANHDQRRTGALTTAANLKKSDDDGDDDELDMEVAKYNAHMYDPAATAHASILSDNSSTVPGQEQNGDGQRQSIIPESSLGATAFASLLLNEDLIMPDLHCVSLKKTLLPRGMQNRPSPASHRHENAAPSAAPVVVESRWRQQQQPQQKRRRYILKQLIPLDDHQGKNSILCSGDRRRFHFDQDEQLALQQHQTQRTSAQRQDVRFGDFPTPMATANGQESDYIFQSPSL